MVQAKGKAKKRGRGRRQRASSDGDSSAGADDRRHPSAAKGRPPAGGGAAAGGRRRGALYRDRKELALVLAEDEADGSKALSWTDMTAGLSDQPQRRFCAVCGCLGKAACPHCAAAKPEPLRRHLCGAVECYAVHRETDCGKRRNLLA